MKSFSPWRKYVAASLFAVAVTSAHAVDVNGRIRGTVTDPAGAVIPGAQVTATNQATGVKFVTKSQANGDYIFQQIPVGTYSINVSAAGFKGFSASGIVINIDQEYVEPARLDLGDAAENISVEADAVQVNTTDMQLNNIVEAAQMVELPNISRSFTLFETIQPGVQGSSDRFGGYSVDGSQSQQSSFLINGADTNDIALNTVTFSPNLDAIDQFNLVSGPLNAEYDRNSGGIVNATLKQGANSFHGDVFEFYRDTFLNTPGYFQYNSATNSKITTPYHQNIFGGTLGGRIIKDKLFFFGAYQGTRQRVPGVDSTGNQVYSALNLQGNFSDDLRATGGNTGNTFSTNPIPGTLNIPGCPAGTTWAACATLKGGVFPTSSFNSVALALVKQYVPAPNTGTNGYNFNSVVTSTQNQYLGRVDFDPNPKNQFSFIFINQRSPSQSTVPFTGATIPGFGEIDSSAVTQGTFDFVRQLSSTAVNDFALHYTRFNYQSVIPQNTVTPSSLGFSISPENAAAASVPTINIANAFSLGFSSNGPQPRIDQVYQVDDNFSKTFGHHNLKFGYDGRRFNVSNPFSANNSGTYGFASSGSFSSGDPSLDFLLGVPSSFTQGSGATIQASAFLNYMYAQDTWRATNNLTFSYGLGYQIDTVLHNHQYGGLAVACYNPGVTSKIFTTAPTGINYPGDPGCTDASQAHTRYTGFGPRIGFAYAPEMGFLSGGSAKKLSIRGGFGIYYNRTEEETSLNNLETPPFGLTSQGAVDYGASGPAFANPYQDIDTGTVYKNKFPYVFPSAGAKIDYSLYEPLGISAYAPGFRSPYSENFQISIERELPSHTIARISYVGALGRHNQTVYEGNPETAAGVAACLTQTTTCASTRTQTYRLYQSYYYPSHTQYGAIDPNTGLPGVTSVGFVTSEGSSNYNSLQISATKSMSHGLEFQASYTLAHALDNASSYENTGYGGTTRGYNQFNTQLNYGNAAFDARNRFVFAPIYTIPFKASGSTFSATNLLLSGWQVSGIAVFAQGMPFDISYGGSSPNSLYCSPGFSFYACPDEPNQVAPLVRANPRVKLANGHTAWFTPGTSFTQAALGTFGNESRNRYHGPGINNTNLILAKNFNLGSDGVRRLQIRMESDNVFNHTQFLNPTSTFATQASGAITQTGVGQISQTQSARQTQLAAKFYF